MSESPSTDRIVSEEVSGPFSVNVLMCVKMSVVDIIKLCLHTTDFTQQLKP